MLVTDWQIGGYHPLMMAAVYFGLALPVFFGGPLRRLLPLDGRRGAPEFVRGAAGLRGGRFAGLLPDHQSGCLVGFGHLPADGCRIS